MNRATRLGTGCATRGPKLPKGPLTPSGLRGSASAPAEHIGPGVAGARYARQVFSDMLPTVLDLAQRCGEWFR